MTGLIKSDKTVLFILTLVFCFFVPFFYMHQGLLSVDTGREFYITSRVAAGDILYKDIFNIYAPFSYMFNAALFIIFGNSFYTLCNCGLVLSFVCVISSYLISEMFLSRFLSFLLSVLIICSLVFSTFLYNSVITYSYGIVYALTFFLLSLLFLLKFSKTDKPCFAYLSGLFAGLSFASKYEFVLYCIILFIILVPSKTLRLKEKLLSFVFFVLPSVICFTILFLNGLSLGDIKNTLFLYQKLITAPSLKVFYANFTLSPFGGNIFKLISFNKIYAIYSFLPLLNIILFIKYFKQIKRDKTLFIFLISAIAAGLKTTLYLNVNHMGLFVFPICIISTAVLISKYRQKLSMLFTVFLICSIFIFASDNFSSLKSKNYLLKTSKGNIYTYPKDGERIDKAVNYLLNNSKASDIVLALPETSVVNYLTDRRGFGIYHSLIPLYYDDVFGEEKILSDFSKSMPEFIVIFNQSTSEYGKKSLCYDYALSFCEMIKDNYVPVKEDYGVKIFGKKDKSNE